MNPYEEPQAQADRPPRDAARRSFWLDLAIAAAIYFACSILVSLVLIPVFVPPYLAFSFSGPLYLAMAQEILACIAGAIYMGFVSTRQDAYLLQGSWRKNGVVYSAATAMLSFTSIARYDPIMGALFAWLMRSIFFTLFTMYFVRLAYSKEPRKK